MFLEKYLSEQKLNLIFSIYDDWFIEGLNEDNFKKVYNIFKKYGFYFIDDIILNYLEIFEMNPVDVIKGLEIL